MSRNSYKNISAAEKYMWARRFGINAIGTPDHDYDNDKDQTWADSADTYSIRAIKVDSDNKINIDSSVVNGPRQPIKFNLFANASLASQAFHIAGRALRVVGIEYSHATAGDDADPVSCSIYKSSGTQSVTAGVALQTSGFDCKGTANTVQYATLVSPLGDGQVNPYLEVAAGDRLAIVFSGVLTTLAGVLVTVWVTPGFKSIPVSFVANANGLVADEAFFIANRDYVITGVSEVHGTLGTNGSAVTCVVTKDTSTNAPGAGTTVLSTTINLKAAINTVQNPALSATATVLRLAAGDRLAFKLTGTATAVAGLVITVYLSALDLGYIGEIGVSWNLKAAASQVDENFFIADRDYIILSASEIHAVAGDDSGTVSADVVIAKGTTAIGSGTAAGTAVFNLKSTANTVQFLTPAARRLIFLSKGDRMGVNFTGTVATLAGVVISVNLLPV